MPDASPRRMSREDRREMLIVAAGRVLGERDKLPLTFEDVAEEAGVSATLPYKYFASPDEIASELYDRIVVDVDVRSKVVLDDDVSFDAKVEATFRLWAETIKREGNLLLALVDGRSIPALRHRMDERREAVVQLWADVIVADFGLDRRTALLPAASITAASSALHVRWLRDRRDLDELVADVVTMARAQCEALRTG
ncbi:TetR/AcrR family transcriptional regulator [Actinospongicola halichondriae]|uniref:TetR/AcrR family transcriptional regulator n=1 Tax=Actinospongicola halichondriae TaxID=3236844 RepID=UPI003D54C914